MTDLRVQWIGIAFGLLLLIVLRPATLKSQRARGVGPPYKTAERLASPLGAPRVRYPLSQILAFEAAHNITPLIP